MYDLQIRSLHFTEDHFCTPVWLHTIVGRSFHSFDPILLSDKFGYTN